MSSGAVPSVGERHSPRESSLATATWYTQKGSNDTWFRADAPAEAVGGRVAYVTDAQIERATTYPNNNTGLPWTACFTTESGEILKASTKRTWKELTRSRLRYTDVTLEFPEHSGAAVWTRPDGRRSVLAQMMREQGVTIVAETDDNYMADKYRNLHQRQVGWDDAAIDIIARAMASFDRNVFSTAWLRDRYLKEYKKRLGKQYLPEMFVCRNHIPQQAWPVRDEGEGQLRVGFMGSGSHVWDVNMIYPVLHDMKKLHKVQVVMVGYNPAEPDKEPDEITLDDGEVLHLRSEKSKQFREKWRKVVDRHVEWVDPGKYHRVPLPLDIGLAPLTGSDDFTRGKSDAKALEYGISGAACVLSTAGIYSAGGWINEVNCLMAGSREEFAQQTNRLIRDPKLRFELVTAAQEMIWNERNQDVMKMEWSAALDL